jgi:hypothetical protein
MITTLEQLGRIPLEEDDDNIYARYEEYTNKIKYDTSFIFDRLENLLHFSILLSLDSEYLNKLSEVCTAYIKENGFENTYQELFFFLSLYCDELVKKHLNKGEWEISESYGVNVFNVPVLVIDGQPVGVGKPILDDMVGNKIDIIHCINVALYRLDKRDRLIQR